ncbi:MAG: FAD-binding domain [Acidobacteria bacterium]|nr:FAD-binding domain [Acidobacteriota bacterium]
MRIAINGTGVAGPALAWWLKHYGYDPVLFERAPKLREGGYLIDFWGIGYDIAERMGILPELKRKGYTIESIDLLDEHGKTIASSDVENLREATGGRLLSITRSDVSAGIFNSLEGVETRFGTSITAAEQTEDGVIAAISDGTQEKFDLVIGADGLHSHIRSEVFGPEQRFETSMGAHVAAFTLSGYQYRDEDIYVSHAAPMKMVSRVSLRDDKTLFLFTFRSELVSSPPQNEEEEKDVIKRAFKDMSWEVPEILARIKDAEDFYFDRVSQIKMENWHDGRIALIGDAAACISLLGGEGTGLAITEAYILAGELYRAKGDHLTAFKNYQKRLKPFLIEKQRSAKNMVFFFAPKNRLQLFLRKMVIRFSSNSLLFKYFIGPMLKDDLDLPDYGSRTS